jgi:hypothetical protein
VRIGRLTLTGLGLLDSPGVWKTLDADARAAVFAR